MLPTPTAGEYKANKTYDKRYQAKSGLTAMAANGMLPTPTAHHHNSGTKAPRKDGKDRTSELNHLIAHMGDGKTSQLNPPFVAEMMGFPAN